MTVQRRSQYRRTWLVFFAFQCLMLTVLLLKAIAMQSWMLTVFAAFELGVSGVALSTLAR